MRPCRHFRLTDRIWRTRDSAQGGGARLDPRLAARPVQVDICVQGAAGQPIRITLADRDGHTVTASSRSPLQVATGAPLDSTKVGKAIGQLGDTPFAIAELSIYLDGADKPLFLALGEIKAARREAVDLALREHITPGTLEKRLAAVTDANGRPQGVGPGSLAVRLELGRNAMKKPTAR